MAASSPQLSAARLGEVGRLIASHEPGLGLQRAFYMDPAVFAHDMDAVFRRHWLCAGHESAIAKPGDYVRLRLEAEQIVIARDASGTVHAFLNVCRHRGAEVCTQDFGNTRSFVCPYHAWTYGLDGSLRTARLMPKGFDTASHGLRKVHVRVVEGLIFISLADKPLDFDPVAQALRSTCGRYGWASAKIAHRETYGLAANWKLAVENYVECYHCAPAHPEYAKTHALQQPAHKIEKLNARMEERTCALGIEIVTGDRWVGSASGKEAVHSFRYALYDGVATGSEDGAALAPLMGDFVDYDGGITSIHVGGASFLVCYPDHGVIYRFAPKTHDACEMELIWLVRGDAVEGADYDLDKLTWLWKVTSEEDKRIIEHTARGVRSHYFVPGPLAPMEHVGRRYLDWYLEELRRT